MTLQKQFTKKVLAIDDSLIEKHKVDSYTAYHIKGRQEKRGQAFFRIYPSKITMLLPYDEIKTTQRQKYNLTDNRDRHPRHELPVKAPPLNQKYIEQDFIDLVKKAFIYTKDK